MLSSRGAGLLQGVRRRRLFRAGVRRTVRRPVSAVPGDQTSAASAGPGSAGVCPLRRDGEVHQPGRPRVALPVPPRTFGDNFGEVVVSRPVFATTSGKWWLLAASASVQVDLAVQS